MDQHTQSLYSHMPIQNFQLVINYTTHKKGHLHKSTIGVNFQFHAYGNGNIQGIRQKLITYCLIQTMLLHDWIQSIHQARVMAHINH
jgi:hypothetical protein